MPMIIGLHFGHGRCYTSRRYGPGKCLFLGDLDRFCQKNYVDFY